MSFKSIHFRSLKGDTFGAVTSAVVALPLALAFGVASGLGAEAGLYSAIAVGFFAALLGGTPTQVSGPTGPMAVAVVGIVATHSDHISQVFAIVILAGLLQVAAGLLKLGKYVIYTPFSVVSGFMSGIGFIIMLMQTAPFLGYDFVGGPVPTINAWPEMLSAVNYNALAVALVSFATCFLWPQRWRRHLPAPLAALLVGTASSVLYFQGLGGATVPVIGALDAKLPSLSIPRVEMNLAVVTGLVAPAVVVALLGCINSLLTALVADSMTGVHHDSDRELFGQGIGNVFSGLIGGMPGSGTTPVTVVNIKAGSQTPISGAAHSVILLGFILGLSPLIRDIPVACLAGILMKVGMDIVNWRFFRRIHETPPENAVTMCATFFIAVFVDLVTAVAVGLIIAGFVSAHRTRRDELSGLIMVPLLDREILGEDGVPEDGKYQARSGMIALSGRFSVASSRDMARLAKMDLKTHEVVIFDFSDVTYMDDSVSVVVGELIAKASERGRCVVVGLSGLKAGVMRVLVDLRAIPKEHFVGDLAAAKKMVADMLRESDSSRG